MLTAMSKSLDELQGLESVLTRLRALTPDSTRRWGRMNPHEAMCHLSDSFRAMMNLMPISSKSNWFTSSFVRWIALHSMIPWPHGVKTMPEVDQELGGTKPAEFDRDKRELEALIEQFSKCTSADLHPHPIFGRLTTDESQRWGYLHVDHHLRQFGK
jgi:hypothetical protein